MSEFVTLEEIRAAKERIAGVAVRTPLYRVERARLRMGNFPEPEFDLYIKAGPGTIGVSSSFTQPMALPA